MFTRPFFQEKKIELFGGLCALVFITSCATSRGSAKTEEGELAESHGLKGEQVRSVVKRNRSDFQQCYETWARESGSREELKLAVDFVIAPSGDVKSVDVEGGDKLGSLGRCIEQKVKGWHFPKAQDPTEASFPMKFSPDQNS